MGHSRIQGSSREHGRIYRRGFEKKSPNGLGFEVRRLVAASLQLAGIASKSAS
jgi:hypothetical protein